MQFSAIYIWRLMTGFVQMSHIYEAEVALLRYCRLHHCENTNDGQIIDNLEELNDILW